MSQHKHVIHGNSEKDIYGNWLCDCGEWLLTSINHYYPMIWVRIKV